MHYKLLNKEEILDMRDGEIVKGVTILRNHAEGTTKSNSSYSYGSMLACGDVDYKAWSGKVHEDLVSMDYVGIPVFITGKVNIWNGAVSVILDSLNAIDASEMGIDLGGLYSTKYDIDKNEKEFYNLLKVKLSEKGMKLFKEIYTRIRPRFREEYAAIKIHDAYRGGLLAHTYKMLKILDLVYETYPNISESVDKDLAFIGLAIHDMGKILEYNNGALSDIHWATHNFLGQEILFEFKSQVVEAFSEEFYYRLQAIIQQHHGEFGEPCHTVEAYLVHLVDMFEYRLEMLEDSLPFNSDLKVEFGKYRLK